MSVLSRQGLGYTENEFRAFKTFAWRYLLGFSLLYCFIYCTRLNLTNASALIMAELPCTRADIGIMAGALFWGYGIGQLVNGRLGEICGATTFVCLAVALSACVNLCMTLAMPIAAMAALWGVNGYCQSMAWAPGIAALTRWWPGNTRGFAIGFVNAFSGFGQAVAMLVTAASLWLVPGMGWKAVFVLPAVLTVALVAVFRLVAKASPTAAGLPEYREVSPERQALERKMGERAHQKNVLQPYALVLANRQFRLWLVITLMSGLSRYGLVTWIPLYFMERFGRNISEGLVQSLALPVGMGIGTFVVPWLTDRFCPHNRLPAVVINGVLGAAAVFCLPLLSPDSTAGLVLLEGLLVVAGFAIYAINGTAFTFATDVGGRLFSGTTSGIVNFSIYVGAALQSVLYGFVLDNGGWDFVFRSIALALLATAALGMLGTRRTAPECAAQQQ